MKKRYKRTFLVLYAFCSLLVGGVSAQSLVLSLEKTISLAADSSLEAFRTKNLFLSGYWEFRNYKAERLPSLTLNITPAEYYRDITKRYDSEKDIDEYRKQQSFYAGGNLKIKHSLYLLCLGTYRLADTYFTGTFLCRRIHDIGNSDNSA